MKGVANLIHQAQRGVELSLPEIASALDISVEHPFDVAIQVEKMLSDLSLCVTPGINKGEFDDRRVVTVEKQSLDVIADEEIKATEGTTLEFKSTFLYDIKQAAARGHPPASELSPDKVIHSTLKTLCGFLNAQGGTLYVGVEDDGAIYGLENDYQFLGKKASFDEWELDIRSRVETSFRDGKQIQSYLQFSKIHIQGRDIARVAVTRRKQESFLKAKNSFEFYYRVGNRTNRISIENLPDIIRQRDQFEK